MIREKYMQLLLSQQMREITTISVTHKFTSKLKRLEMSKIKDI